MPLFLANTGLECMMKDGQLDQKVMDGFIEKSQVMQVPDGKGFCCSYLFESGLELFSRVPDPQTSEAMVDMHMSGKCIWTVKPVTLLPQDGFFDFALLASDVDEKNACMVNLVKSVFAPHFDGKTKLDLQVCAFPIDLSVYDSRSAFEAMASGDGRLTDGQVVPYNYILAHEESLSKDAREKFGKNERLALFCGQVLGVQKRENGYRGTKLDDAVVSTAFGHIDVVYGENQLDRKLEKGCYIVASAFISAEIIKASPL